MGRTSKIEKFYDLNIDQRLRKVAEFSDLTEEEAGILLDPDKEKMEIMDHIIENVFSTLELPVGVATNFVINGRDYLIPMAVEEASIVAACSNAAKIARSTGGFTAEAGEPIIIGQIQLVDYGNADNAKASIMKNTDRILSLANSRSRTLSSMNAGAKDINIRVLDDLSKSMVIHLLVDVRDAMGANIVNTMCETVAPFIEEITGGKVNLRILSNLTPQRIAKSRAIFPASSIGGREVVRRIISACEMANIDPYRAATHNKGIMNGIDSVLMVTMNDWRAAEANAHTYSHISGNLSLTRYYENESGDLVGEINIPISVGVVGGTTGAIQKVKIFRKILGVNSSREFSMVLASVGLAQNFAALRALCSEGIQKGHMSLHARNVAITAGARGQEAEKIAEIMVKRGNISVSSAQEIMADLRNAYNEKDNHRNET
ncbi:MAG: hydroxymethylglutaryl-CoA reductase, degradative [Thermoplasmataceae archaeon]|jgi:hydroxymethylglutaryl-CoA reductase